MQPFRGVLPVQVRIGNSDISSSSPSPNVGAQTPTSVGNDVPVSELAALEASGAKLNRKQRRALERYTGKQTSSAEVQTKAAVSTASPSPETANVQVPSSSSETTQIGTLAELKALHASGTPLNRKQRRAFARLSKDD